MKIQLNTLRRIIRETFIAEIATYSSLDLKPGTVLRYTGSDMEMPPLVKVIHVQDGVVTAGDKRGKVHKITDKDLHMGEYEVMN